jgi:5-methylcytosine-specific restriction protein A
MPWKPQQHRPHGVATKRTPHTRTTRERGYDYAWQKFRERIIAERITCEDCDEEGIVTPGEELHHLEKIRHSPEKRLDPENVRLLCGRHHRIRTARGE